VTVFFDAPPSTCYGPIRGLVFGGVPVWQPLLNGSPEWYYHSKPSPGLLSDSSARITPPPRMLPTSSRIRTAGTVPRPNLFEQLLERESLVGLAAAMTRWNA
jgi:hypothetical protein